MASGSSPPVEFVRSALALHSLDHCGRIHNPRGGSRLFRRAQRKATLSRDPAGRGSRGELLDWTVLLAGHLFSAFREFQQNVWNAWRGNRVDGLAVLDWLRHAGGSRTKRRASQDQRRRQVAGEARASCDHKHRHCSVAEGRFGCSVKSSFTCVALAQENATRRQNQTERWLLKNLYYTHGPRFCV